MRARRELSGLSDRDQDFSSFERALWGLERPQRAVLHGIEEHGVLRPASSRVTRYGD